MSKSTSIIDPSFKHGSNFQIGHYCVIEKDVVVGNDIEICNFVLLKEGTTIGNNCFLDSYFRSSGHNQIANNVTLRFGSTIAKNVHVEDYVFISPNVMTVFLIPDRPTTKPTLIKRGAFIGTAAVIAPGLVIGPGVIIGANSYVNKDCLETGVYAGSPAKKIRP